MAFDQSGSLRWSVAGNYQPQIATADGTVIATDDSGAAVTFDENGNATGQMAQHVQSWTLNTYLEGSQVQQAALAPIPPLFGFAAVQGGNPSNSWTYVRPRTSPQEALIVLATANLTATPQCNSLLAQFAVVAQIPEATLIKQLQSTANSARDYVYDGPTSNTSLDPIKFPGAASPGVATVGQWFASNNTYPSYADGFSQFNGNAVWFRLDNWHGWVLNQFTKFFSTKLNYYALGTVMHEILHKQAVGGGFTHNKPPDARDMDRVISLVGWPSGMVDINNRESEAFGLLCFPNLR